MKSYSGLPRVQGYSTDDILTESANRLDNPEYLDRLETQPEEDGREDGGTISGEETVDDQHKYIQVLRNIKHALLVASLSI